MELRDDLIALEEAFWAAAGDGEHYRRRFADDGVLLVPGLAQVMDKDATVAAVAQAEPWSSFSLEDVRCVELAPGVAALAYRGLGERAGQRYEAMISSVYVHRPAGWELAVHQQTPLDS